MSDPAGPPRPPRLAPAPTREAREAVVDALTRHFAADRLTLDEFELRVERAYAVAAPADLDALVADVGGLAPAAPALPQRILALLSNQERRGPAEMPRHLRVVAVAGNVELDLRETAFLPGVSEIQVSAVCGNVEITLPAGLRVEIVGSAVLGSFSAAGAPDVGDGRTVLRVRGRAVLSNVEARSTRAGAPSAFARPDAR